jgi:hypothetical protein
MDFHTSPLPQSSRDSRVVVLVALAAGILAASFFSYQPEPVTYTFYQTGYGQQRHLLLTEESSAAPLAGSGFKKIRTDLSCHDTPLELARFFNLPLAINRAAQEDLTLLPGIGNGLAEKIIAFRTEQGRISDPAMLIQVHGIGEKMKKRLAPLLCFD